MGLAVLIDHDKLRVAHRGKVVKSADYIALTSAQEILRQADAGAQALQQQARDAYRQQHEAGYRDGLAEAQAQFAQRMLADACADAQRLTALQARIVNVVMRALRAILHETDEQALLEQCLRRVAALLQGERFVVLRVCPAQEAKARAALANLTEQFGSTEFIEVRGDARLAAGACVVESDSGVIEASLETQLAAVEIALKGSFGPACK